MIRRYLLAVILIGSIISSALIATRAFAADPIPFPFPFTPSAPPVDVDTEFTVASRVSFDPNAAVTITGAGDTNSQITSDFAQVSFTALDFKKVRISGVQIQNHGTTNTIASLEVETPQDFLVDVKKSIGTNDVRSLTTNKFAIPIDGALGSTPGIATVDIDLMYWNNSAVITPTSSNDDSMFKPDFWTAFIASLIPSNATPTFPFQPAYAASTLTVIKWQDTDRDGIEDAGEPRLSGWTIQVYRRNADSSLTLTATGTTDSNGIYTNSGLSGGATWVVREVFPTPPSNCNWVQIFPGAASSNQHELFIANNAGATVKFGNALDCTAPLVVTKFFDKNRNGVQDGTDTTLSGWTIKVYDNAGTTLVGQGVTGPTGTVTFNLPTGATYKVREDFASIPPNCPGGQWIQILPGGPSYEHTVSNLPYPAGSSVKFGNGLDCKASIFKFFDANGNGVHDLSEGGIQGWNIQVYDQTGTNLLSQQFTDPSGTAMFTLQQDQTYVAREVIPDEASCSGGIWHQTFPGAPSHEHQFYLPLDGGVSLKFGNEQICPTELYIVTLNLSSLD